MCVADSLRAKQPFLRIPSIVTNMTLEAFLPIRLVTNAMAYARETILAASITINPTDECIEDYQRLRFCSLCAGILTINPCSFACDQLSDLCAPQLLQFGPQWKTFMSAMQQALDQLDKFPRIHRPLQMHLTDAIMNLKSVFTSHEKEILSNCSSFAPTPKLAGVQWPYSGPRRVRRQAPRAADGGDSYYRPSVYQPPGNIRHPAETKPLPSVALAEQGVSKLQAWVREVKQRLEVGNVFFFSENVPVKTDPTYAIVHFKNPATGLRRAPSNPIYHGACPLITCSMAFRSHMFFGAPNALAVASTCFYICSSCANTGNLQSGHYQLVLCLDVFLALCWTIFYTKVTVEAFGNPSEECIVDGPGLTIGQSIALATKTHGSPPLPPPSPKSNVSVYASATLVMFILPCLNSLCYMPYNQMSYLFDNMGSELCNAKRNGPPPTAYRSTSNTCWNGTSLDSTTSRSVEPKTIDVYFTDPTLYEKELGLRKAIQNFEILGRVTQVDPDILPLADPAATVLKVGRNDMPVDSDEEALRSYLTSPTSPNSNENSLGGQGDPSLSLWEDQQPPSAAAAFASDTEAGSGYGDVPLPYVSPYSPPMGYKKEDDFNNPVIHPEQPPGSNGAPPQPPRSYVPDDEDFRQQTENSGYEPMGVYGYPEPTQPSWPRQPQPPYDSAPVVPPIHWDTEPDSPEGSGSDPLGPNWSVKPSPDWKPSRSPQPLPPQQTDSGLVVGGGKVDIPDQIWVPEGDGVVHMSVPPYLRTTAGTSTFSPNLAAFFVVGTLQRWL
ncbi:unnamed protein product [Mesocestoides corti]|uniref:Glypican n=2 Tax=Mesocestoides corti TaxID=53468 RepID=A0A158QUV6_MESCO|nr:unnamed protein product [Mesocestoides corti]